MSQNNTLDYKLTVRRMKFSYSDGIPKDWANNDIVLSHMYNIFNISLPETERVFVKSVSDVIPTIKNEKLKKIAIGYAGQEAQHSKEHKRACAVLEGQGYSLNRVTSVLNAIGFGLPSRFFGKKFAVALAGAFEHVTILVARNVLGKNLLEGSNHEMRQLFEWHVAEEVEHRNAVHDVMSEVCPGFIYRLLGILMAAGILFVQSYIGTFMLLYQDGKAFKISSQITYFKHYGLYYPSPYEMIVHYLYPNYSPDMYIDDSILQKVDSVLNHREAA